jgi:hypothetical protein
MSEHPHRVNDEHHDREFWAAEAALLGTDWPGVIASLWAWHALLTKPRPSVDPTAGEGAA